MPYSFVVWFRLETKKGLVRGRQTPIKKFKNGEPALDYFGGGMYSNYLSRPKKRPMRAYEIFPTLNERQLSFRDAATDSPRSFELCKHSDNDHIQLAIRSTADDIEGYAKSLGVEYNDTNLSILPIVSKNALEKNPLCYFFDFELEHQLNFTAVDTGQEPIINKLIRAMSAKGCAILIQFLFTAGIKWNDVASVTSNNLSRLLQKIDAGKTERVITGITRNFVPMLSAKTIPDVRGRSSSEYIIGKKVEEIYHQKASSAPISLSIRGMIIGAQDDIQATIRHIAPVFEKIVFSNDFLRYWDYEVDSNLAYDWLVNNEVAGDAAIQTLKDNQNMWSNPGWGVGRDFVPFLCLTMDELPVFVSLPTDPELPIFFKRKKIRNTNYGGMVLPLGTIS